MVYKEKDTKKAERLFEGWQEAMVWACLQAIMGSIYTDDEENPRSAMAVLGDFCFFAGKPNRELVLYKPETCRHNVMIMIPRTEEWGEIIADSYGEKAKKVKRYAFKKEGNVFDADRLEKAVCSLPPGYLLKRIEEEEFDLCKQFPWCEDFVSQYTDYNHYRDQGIGFLITKNGIPVSGASAYARYKDGIEIEIDTKEEYRRKGLAYICGAKLILECLEHNLYPSWDAQNQWSASLAEKLGYHFDHVYTAYEIWDYLSQKE